MQNYQIYKYKVTLATWQLRRCAQQCDKTSSCRGVHYSTPGTEIFLLLTYLMVYQLDCSNQKAQLFFKIYMEPILLGDASWSVPLLLENGIKVFFSRLYSSSFAQFDFHAHAEEKNRSAEGNIRIDRGNWRVRMLGIPQVWPLQSEKQKLSRVTHESPLRALERKNNGTRMDLSHTSGVERCNTKLILLPSNCAKLEQLSDNRGDKVVSRITIRTRPLPCGIRIPSH